MTCGVLRTALTNGELGLIKVGVFVLCACSGIATAQISCKIIPAL